ncbi:MAG: MarR family winged helix-turn-helix transcriptional regulator [Eubacteriales bacterium]|nr:MarR family winged helix-turn-helix transcriptional regulator [Eubacteriales bacterium]
MAMQKEMENDARKFCDAWQGIDMIYEDYARSVDIPYTSLYILNMLTQTENCTQKLICERTLLPKQTVNTVITGFWKSGLVELRELPEDRRTKAIHLTQKGREYADDVIPHIREAENRAMARLSDAQRKALLEGMEIYCEAFREEMMAGR